MKLHERWETASKATSLASEDTLWLIWILKRYAQKTCDWTVSKNSIIRIDLAASLLNNAMSAVNEVILA